MVKFSLIKTVLKKKLSIQPYTLNPQYHTPAKKKYPSHSIQRQPHRIFQHRDEKYERMEKHTHTCNMIAVLISGVAKQPVCERHTT